MKISIGYNNFYKNIENEDFEWYYEKIMLIHVINFLDIHLTLIYTFKYH